ncbi:tetratricopeptide repeat protein [Streptomyces halobius]|uniref:Tetratricopeptide repeat protein n=1 Tax=Streptomyces halobius TaxID=2879846 RepID=A0ABY4MJQ9_9ACTN|nr:tetratricopeptide repeat protein [Streptomyces halobius]UQA96640.1 tetratricopeptide repeat protein [Streptomyces halobius]
MTAHAAHHSVAIASVGQVVYHAAPREPAAWPHQVGAIPSRAQSFQHRAEAQRLRAAVDGGDSAVLGQVLTGMGGVGKTQLAADYARTCWAGGSLDVLVWITASARTPVVNSYAQAGVELCQADPGDAEQAAGTFLAWLTPKAGAKPCRWLIILDDVADPDDLRGLWPPPSRYGRTLVTTRRRDAALTGEGRRRIEVGLFTEAEAVAYLTASLAARGRHEPVGQITALARDLSYLPLALAQAAAYLIDSGESVAAYRELLSGRTTMLADTAPDRLPDDQAIPVAAAWSLSIDHADALNPVGLARPMLHLAAMLDPNGIPHAVLTSRPALAHLAQHRTQTGQGLTREGEPVSLRDAVRALRALHRLSLIDHTPATPHQAIRVHQLIQRATRDALTPAEHEQHARTAADALMAAWPEIERDPAVAQALRANTTALTTHSEVAMYRPNTHEALYRTGNSYGQVGQVAAARDHFQYLAEAAHHHLGPDHPNTLAARGYLARWCGETGDVAGAAASIEEVLEQMMRVLGGDHPDTLTTRHNLAYWRGAAGDAAGAAATFAELLTDRVRVLGEDHPHTLTTRHNVARWRGETGDAAGAAADCAKLLTDRVRVLGEDHPDTLTTEISLARWRGQAGNASGAAAAFAELLADRVRRLGENHPSTLTTRHNLAYCRGMAGDAAGAAAAFAELLSDRARVLSENHPHTLATWANCAYWCGKAGDAAGAAASAEELLEHMMRVLGNDHPDTLNIRGILASWRGKAGDASGAAAAFAELLSDRARVLGRDHPTTLAARRNLAYWRGKAGGQAQKAGA